MKLSETIRGGLEQGDLLSLDLLTTAKALGYSRETIRRRLTAEGTSWRALVKQERERRLRDFMARPGRLRGEDGADALGYAEVQSFFRFFESTTGRGFREWLIERQNVAF